MKQVNQRKILFLNQIAGPLFRELAEDIAHKDWPNAVLFTGYSSETLRHEGINSLKVVAGPEYNRSNNWLRLYSWFFFEIKAFLFVLAQPKDAVLFIVSNPPFLGLLGLFFKKIRRQKYTVLVYDIYPDVLLALGKLRKGKMSRIWDLLNRIVYSNAEVVFTIGNDMAQRLENKFVYKERCQKIVYIPCWADISFIKPLSKEKNWFAKKHKQIGKTTVLYSGNMGNTHDIESVLAAAVLLADEPDIHFLFIGDGAKQKIIKESIKKHRLENITLLPFQSEEVIPYSLPTGDIGIIAYQPGTEGCMVPSKTYYYLAAGLAVLVVSNEDNDVKTLIEKFHCGRHVNNNTHKDIANVIMELHSKPALLKEYKTAARKAAEQYFSRKNSNLFSDVMKKFSE